MHHERGAEFEYVEKVEYAEKRTRVKAELGAVWVWEYNLIVRSFKKGGKSRNYTLCDSSTEEKRQTLIDFNKYCP